MATAVRGSARTTRLRKVECVECGYVARVSRRWIATGVPSCPCGGGEMSVPDMEDACYVPGDVGVLASEIAGQAGIDFARRSENAKKAIQSRMRCKCGSLLARGELTCRKCAMPF